MKLSDQDTYLFFSNYYRPQGKVLFSEASVILSGEGGGSCPWLEGDPTLEADPPGGRQPMEVDPLNEHGTRSEVTSYTPGKNMGPDRKWHDTPQVLTSSGGHCSGQFPLLQDRGRCLRSCRQYYHQVNPTQSRDSFPSSLSLILGNSNFPHPPSL